MATGTTREAADCACGATGEAREEVRDVVAGSIEILSERYSLGSVELTGY